MVKETIGAGCRIFFFFFVVVWCWGGGGCFLPFTKKKRKTRESNILETHLANSEIDTCTEDVSTFFFLINHFA